jgi:SET domain-containing protein
MCIECVSGHCPSGAACTNQRFQRRDYPLVTLFDAGKKGYGVRTTSDIKSGQLVIEYVGEVISIDEARKRMGVDSDDSSDEADTPRKRRRAHFYTLTLTGNECIDASRKGNVARFINHSCDPNCITQKW